MPRARLDAVGGAAAALGPPLTICVKTRRVAVEAALGGRGRGFRPRSLRNEPKVGLCPLRARLYDGLLGGGGGLGWLGWDPERVRSDQIGAKWGEMGAFLDGNGAIRDGLGLIWGRFGRLNG